MKRGRGHAEGGGGNMFEVGLTQQNYVLAVLTGGGGVIRTTSFTM